jgi:hypothetical protein
MIPLFPYTRGSIALILWASILSACGGGGGGSPDTSPVVNPTVTTIDKPVALNLYPNQSSTNVPRITVMVTSVGSALVDIPAVFDTGSAGVTLYAPNIFPANMVTATGFVFPAGQASLTYNGITVTNQQGTRTYGTTDLRAQNGNLGFATLTFGDAQGKLTTTVTPVFFYYSVTDVTTGQVIDTSGSLQLGIFGVASTSGEIVVTGTTEPAGGFPACATDTIGSCYTVSPLKYLQYAAGVHAGFMLAPATIQTCDIDSAGSCPPEPILTVGLDTALESGFSTLPLPCPPNGYVGPASIAGYLVCQKTTDNVTIMLSGGATGSITGGAVFDTGTSNMQIAVPEAGSFPAAVPLGASVLVTTPSGFTYSYVNTGFDPSYTVVNSGFTGSSIVGIGYFTTNWFFIDFTSSLTGWK